MRIAKLLILCLALVVAVSAMSMAAMEKRAHQPGKPAPDLKAAPNWWGPNPNRPPAVKGIVENVSATSIAVKTRDGVKGFIVDANTRVIVCGAQATINDVKVGDTVGVRFKPVENSLPVALGIMVPRPRFSGQIASIQGSSIVLVDKAKNEHRLVVTDKTKYRSRGYQGTVADLRIGYRASAVGEISGGVMHAEAVEFMPTVARGTVIAKQGDIITVKTVRQATLVLKGSPATAVLIRPRVADNKKGTLADIQVGMPVNVGFHTCEGGPAPLLWIDVLTGS